MDPVDQPDPAGDVQTVRYGDDSQQFAELSRPDGASPGVVVVIHGGFWRARYDLSLGRPLAAALVAAGWTAYNVEYRRTGNGGGWPATWHDIAAAIDALTQFGDIDLSRVITLGHSAGGHLAVLAAALPPVTAAISQAGVLDLDAAIREDLGAGAVKLFLGGTLEDHNRSADPLSHIPAGVPVRCVHARADDTVPISQSVAYVDRAVAAGADATLTEVAGDHYTVIDPLSAAWAQTMQILNAV